MMTKTTSQTKAILKKIAIIPFIFGLVYFLCFETVAQENNVSVKVQTDKKENPTKDRRDEYYAGVRIIVKDCNKKTIVDKQYEELTLEEKNNYFLYVPEPLVEKSPTEKEFSDFKNNSKYAIWIDGKHFSNTQLNQYTASDFVYFNGSSVKKNARNNKFPQPFQYHFYTKDYFDKNLKNSWKKFEGKEIISTINCKDKWDKTNNFEKLVEEKETVKVVENINLITEKTLPEYQGGMQEFYKFFGENYKIPSDFKGNGRLYIQFIVETDGSLSEFQVLRDLGFGTGEEAVRVLKITPKWIPGKEDGKEVRMKFALPIALQGK